MDKDEAEEEQAEQEEEAPQQEIASDEELVSLEEEPPQSSPSRQEFQVKGGLR